MLGAHLRQASSSDQTRGSSGGLIRKHLLFLFCKWLKMTECTNGWIYLVSNVRCLKKSWGFEGAGRVAQLRQESRGKGPGACARPRFRVTQGLSLLFPSSAIAFPAPERSDFPENKKVFTQRHTREVKSDYCKRFHMAESARRAAGDHFLSPTSRRPPGPRPLTGAAREREVVAGAMLGGSGVSPGTLKAHCTGCSDVQRGNLAP